MGGYFKIYKNKGKKKIPCLYENHYILFITLIYGKSHRIFWRFRPKTN